LLRNNTALKSKVSFEETIDLVTSRWVKTVLSQKTQYF